MSETRLPSKLFFRIGEVAGLVGVEPHVLRYWEREFRSIRPTKSAKGQRVYSRRDVENLLRVRDLLYRDGFTIAGAKKRLQRGALAASAAADDGAAAALEEAPDGALDGSHLQRAAYADASSLYGEGRDLGSDGEDTSGEDEHALPGSDRSREGTGDGASPASAPARSARDRRVIRHKLEAMRTEIEAFLVELEGADSTRNNGDALERD